MPPELGVRSEIAGGALKVDLCSSWSDSVNCGCSWEVRCDRDSCLLQKLQKRDLVAWIRASILLRVNF